MLRESPFTLTPVDRALRQVLDCAAPRGTEEKTIWDERVRGSGSKGAQQPPDPRHPGAPQLCGQVCTEAIINEVRRWARRRPQLPSLTRLGLPDSLPALRGLNHGRLRRPQRGRTWRSAFSSRDRAARPDRPISDAICAARQYTVTSSVTAGQASSQELQPGEVAYITTGAPVPPGADAVVKVRWRGPARRAASSTRSPLNTPVSRARAPGGVDRGRWPRLGRPRARAHSARRGARAVDAPRRLRHRGRDTGPAPEHQAQRLRRRAAGHGASPPPQRC